MKYRCEEAYQERIRLVDVLKYRISPSNGPEFGRKLCWHVCYLGWIDGVRLFYPDGYDGNPMSISSWWKIPTDCWLYQSNDAHPTDNFWSTMDEELAERFIKEYGWKVRVDDVSIEKWKEE